MARFISRDPLRFGGGDINLYRAVGNNGVNWRDPYGLKFVSHHVNVGTFNGDKSVQVSADVTVEKPSCGSPVSKVDIFPRTPTNTLVSSTPMKLTLPIPSNHNADLGFQLYTGVDLYYKVVDQKIIAKLCSDGVTKKSVQTRARVRVFQKSYAGFGAASNDLTVGPTRAYYIPIPNGEYAKTNPNEDGYYEDIVTSQEVKCNDCGCGD